MARSIRSLDVSTRFVGFRLALAVMYCLGALRVPRRAAWAIAANLCWVRVALGTTSKWYRLAALVDVEDL